MSSRDRGRAGEDIGHIPILESWVLRLGGRGTFYAKKFGEIGPHRHKGWKGLGTFIGGLKFLAGLGRRFLEGGSYILIRP